MTNQRIPKCKSCGVTASIAGQIFATVADIMEVPDNGYLCSDCFKIKREAEKEHIADQGCAREEEYESEQEYARGDSQEL